MRSPISNCTAPAILGLLLLGGCQKRQEPVPTLTQDQWRRVQENILTEAPAVQHPVDAVFGDSFRLIGWDIEPEPLGVGDPMTVTFYWEVLQATNQRWRIFVHVDGNTRQNLDHEAMGDVFPTVYWERGQIIRDVVHADLATGMSEGDVTFFLGFFHDEERMPVTRAGEGAVEEDGRLRIGAVRARWEAPQTEIRRAVGQITLDGRLSDRAWSRAQQTDAWRNPNSGDAVTFGDAWAKLLWDDEYLYIGLFADDTDIWSTIAARDGTLWDEEVLEVYIDPARNGRNYLELQFNPLNTVFDALFASSENRVWQESAQYTVPGMETAVHVGGTTDDREDADRNWSVEVRIPLASLQGLGNLPPRDGDTMRMNFYRYDRPAGGEVLTSAWSPVGGGSFHQPERFGIATFRGQAPRLRAPEGSGQSSESDGSGAPPANGSGEALIRGPLRVEPGIRVTPTRLPLPPGAPQRGPREDGPPPR